MPKVSGAMSKVKEINWQLTWLFIQSDNNFLLAHRKEMFFHLGIKIGGT
jgi:hypothetical protein